MKVRQGFGRRWRHVVMAAAFLVLVAPLSARGQSSDPIELNVMTWMYQPGSPAWDDMVSAFQSEHPHIRLNLISGGREEQADKLLLMMTGGAPVDAVWTDAAMTNVYTLYNLLEDLSSYFEDPAFPRDEYASAGFEEHAFGDGRFAFPSTMGTYFFYYNQEIFDQRGVPHLTGDWDRDEFLDIARALRDPVAGIYAVDNRNWVTTFLPWLWANGTDWFTPDRRRSLLDSPTAIEIQQFLADLIHVYDVHIPYPDDTDYFSQGRLAMLHSSTWDIQGTELTPSKWPFRWSAAPPPKGPHGQFTVLQTNGWSIPKGAAHPEEAWAFISWFNGPAGQRILASHGEFPAHIPTAQSESFLHLDGATRAQIFSIVMMGRPFPVNPVWQDSLAIGWQLQGEALSGQKDPGIALRQAAEQINARIDAMLQLAPW